MASWQVLLVALLAGSALLACGGGGEAAEPAFDLATAQVWIATGAPSEDGVGPVHLYEPFTGEVGLLGPSGEWIQPAWSSDGSRIALWDLSPGGHMDVAVLRTGDGVELGRFELENGIKGQPESQWPLWSPDGTRIAVQTWRRPYLFDRDLTLLGEAEVPEGRASYSIGLAWSADSELFVAPFGHVVLIMDREGEVFRHEFPFAGPEQIVGSSSSGETRYERARLEILTWTSPRQLYINDRLRTGPPVPPIFELTIDGPSELEWEEMEYPFEELIEDYGPHSLSVEIASLFDEPPSWGAVSADGLAEVAVSQRPMAPLRLTRVAVRLGERLAALDLPALFPTPFQFLREPVEPAVIVLPAEAPVGGVSATLVEVGGPPADP